MRKDENKGFFKPKFPQKYKGNPTRIVWRSTWELKYMMKLDYDPGVEEWASEERFFSIPYWDPTRKIIGRYFPDFWIKYKDGKIAIIEIKPASQTKPSKSTNKKRFFKESITYTRNTAKWSSARTFCENKGWEFIILTEKELKIPTY